MYKFDKYECGVAIRYGQGSSASLEARAIPCYPEEVASAVSASWNQQSIVGRTGTIKAFTGTSDVTSNFSFDLHRDMNINNRNMQTSADEFGAEVDDLVRFLKSGCYPMYGTGSLYPPRTLFRFGDLYISGVLKEVSTTWKKPIIDKAYAVCSISISMESADRRIIDYSDVRDGTKVTTRGHMIDTDHNTTFHKDGRSILD